MGRHSTRANLTVGSISQAAVHQVIWSLLLYSVNQAELDGRAGHWGNASLRPRTRRSLEAVVACSHDALQHQRDSRDYLLQSPHPLVATGLLRNADRC